MSPHHLHLAADFLDAYADRLGNDGCNDWEWPESFPVEAREPFIREMERLNGTPEEADESVEMYLQDGPPNFAVVGTLIGMLREYADVQAALPGVRGGRA